MGTKVLPQLKTAEHLRKIAPFEIDGFYELYETRCVEYKADPPVPLGEEWDGVFTATTK